MSFFDEVETTVANTRFLQAVEDHQPVKLELKDIAELKDIEDSFRKECNIDICMKHDTTCNYLFFKYAKQKRHTTFVNFLEDLGPFAKASSLKRKILAKEIHKKYIVVPKEQEEAPVVEAEPKPQAEALPGQVDERKSIDENAVPKPIVDKEVKLHTWLEKQYPGLVEALGKTLEESPVDTWDHIVSVIKDYFEKNLLAGFLESELFTQQIQLMDYAKKEVSLKDFRVFRVLGRGAFGAVSAVQKLDTHGIFAMKEMDKKQVKVGQSEWMCINEKKVLSRMCSPFVLNLDYSFHNEDSLFLIFVMLGGGDLKFHLRNEKDRCFAPDRARFYAAETLLGLEHIHSFDIVYRDLKPGNILLSTEGHVVISDLGLTIRLRPNKVLRHLAGTAGYWAPEILSKTGTYKTSDYWSFGVMLYEMLIGHKPDSKCQRKTKEWSPFGQTQEMEDNALMEDGKLRLDVDYPEDKLSPEAIDLLKLLFEPDPEKRIGAKGADEIKAHPYFKPIDWDQLSRLELTPPYIPDNRTVHANSIGEVGEFNKQKYKKTKLTAEDEDHYQGFYYAAEDAMQRELVEALRKMDAPPDAKHKANLGDDSKCCTIL